MIAHLLDSAYQGRAEDSVLRSGDKLPAVIILHRRTTESGCEKVAAICRTVKLALAAANWCNAGACPRLS